MTQVSRKIFELLATLIVALVPGFLAAENPIEFVPPKVPGFMGDVLVFDSNRVQALREKYESSAGKVVSGEDFMFSYRPGEIFKSILHGDFKPEDLASDFGLLYWSGIEGGVWLNKIMTGPEKSGIGPSGLIRAFKGPVLIYMDLKTGQRLRLIQKHDLPAKRIAVEKSLGLLARSYGYNRGYLLEILKHPPAGAAIPDNYLVCKELLDCNYGVADLSIIAPLLPVREKLSRPPDQEWLTLSKTVSEQLPGSINQGKGVWKNILSNRGFSPASYQSLVDISAGFLLINEAILLQSAQAVAEGDETQLNRALAADTALKIWLAGYMMGLSQQ